MKYHPLTDKLRSVISYSINDDVDIIVRRWLKDKARLLKSISNTDVWIDKEVEKILELAEPTLEEKFIKELGGKCLKVQDGEFYLDNQLGILAKIAKEHYECSK